MIRILQMIASIDTHIIPDAAILIDDGIAYITSFANTQLGQPTRYGMVHFLDGLEIIGSHYIAAYDGGTMPNAAADADHAVLDTAGIDDAAFGNDRFFQRSAADLGGRQHACAGIYGIPVIE